MNPTPDQIASAARLVPGAFVGDDGQGHKYGKCLNHCPHDAGDTYQRDCCAPDCLEELPWQPWSDTEAGRSDALVLLAVVMKWISDNDFPEKEWSDSAAAAMQSGNVQQIQQAAFDAAVAIGEYMGATNDH